MTFCKCCPHITKDTKAQGSPAAWLKLFSEGWEEQKARGRLGLIFSPFPP